MAKTVHIILGLILFIVVLAGIGDIIDMFRGIARRSTVFDMHPHDPPICSDPSHTDDPIGKVGRCSKGELGLITHKKLLEWGESYVGIKLSDGTPWASRNPTIIPWEDVVKFAEAKVT